MEKVSGKDIKRPKLREMLEYIREDATVYVSILYLTNLKKEN
ncbi:MAG: hypothetical protein ACLRL7_13515 [Blautia wexlerae]